MEDMDWRNEMRNTYSLDSEPKVKKDGVVWRTLEYMFQHQETYLSVEQIAEGTDYDKGKLAPRMTEAYTEGLVLREKIKNPLRHPGKKSDRYKYVHGYKISDKGMQAIGHGSTQGPYTLLVDKYKGNNERWVRVGDDVDEEALKKVDELLTAESEKLGMEASIEEGEAPAPSESTTPEVQTVPAAHDGAVVPSIITKEEVKPHPKDQREAEMGVMATYLKKHGVDPVEIAFAAVKKEHNRLLIEEKTTELKKLEREIEVLKRDM